MATAVTLPPVSNQEDWTETIQVFDEDGIGLNMSAVTALTLVVWDPDNDSEKLRLALNSGITITDSSVGVITISAAVGTMQSFIAKNYAFRLGMVNGGVTKDLILPGILPIEDGGP